MLATSMDMIEYSILSLIPPEIPPGKSEQKTIVG